DRRHRRPAPRAVEAIGPAEERLPLWERVTHPRTHGFRDATFDFIFAKGLTALQPTITPTNASDHWPVTRNFRLHRVRCRRADKRYRGGFHPRHREATYLISPARS